MIGNLEKKLKQQTPGAHLEKGKSDQLLDHPQVAEDSTPEHMWSLDESTRGAVFPSQKSIRCFGIMRDST